MAILIAQPNGGANARIATVLENGTHVLVVTAQAPDGAVLLQQPNGEWAKIATLSGDADGLRICVRGG